MQAHGADLDPLINPAEVDELRPNTRKNPDLREGSRVYGGQGRQTGEVREVGKELGENVRRVEAGERGVATTRSLLVDLAAVGRRG